MTAKPYAGMRLPEDQARALAALHAAVAETVEEHGISSVPCLGAERDLWVSEDRAEQEDAADKCLDCRCFLACVKYRSNHIESGAVYAGTLPGRKVS